MIGFLRGLFERPEGYIAGREIPLGAMTDARPGARVASSGPPYMIVCRDIRRVRPPLWPDRLWRVRVLTVPPDNGGESLPKTEMDFTRACAVEIVEEVAAWRIFGAHGEAVAELIEIAQRLDADMAARLAAARHLEAGAVYSRVWSRWIARNLPASPHRDLDHEGTLKVVGGECSSPVNEGLAMINEAAAFRARAVCGDAAYRVENENDLALNPPWDGAAQTLVEAALARGAPQILERGEREILDAAVSSVR